MPKESSQQFSDGLILVPQSPTIRTLLWMIDREKEIIVRKRFLFPHSLFAMFYFKTPKFPFYLKRLHVIWGQEPFTGENLEEKFYGLPIRNHDGDFSTCFMKWDNGETPEKFARTVINQYWSSPFVEFNDWASWWTKRYKSLAPDFFKEWEEASNQQNYNWIFQQTLLQSDHHVNLKKLLEANKSNYEKEGIQIVNLISPKIEFKL